MKSLQIFAAIECEYPLAHETPRHLKFDSFVDAFSSESSEFVISHSLNAGIVVVVVVVNRVNLIVKVVVDQLKVEARLVLIVVPSPPSSSSQLTTTCVYSASKIPKVTSPQVVMTSPSCHRTKSGERRWSLSGGIKRVLPICGNASMAWLVLHFLV